MKEGNLMNQYTIEKVGSLNIDRFCQSYAQALTQFLNCPQIEVTVRYERRNEECVEN